MRHLTRWAAWLMLALPALAQAKGEAVFGFQWGQTPAQLRAAGLKLVAPKEGGRSGNYQVFTTPTAPKPFSRSEGYLLLFDDHLGLVKVQMGFEVHDDPTGEKGTEAFDQVSDLLASKYKIDPEHTLHEVGHKLYTQADEFYQCLKHPGCGVWADTYQADNKVMVVQLRGQAPGEGAVTLTAEAVPEFDQAQAQQKIRLREQDRNAL